MRPEDLEFLIAQHADGSLDPQRSAELEAVLRRDASARALLHSYKSIDGALAGIAANKPLPELQWDQLEARLSDQIGQFRSEAPLTEEAEETLSRLSSGQASSIEQSLIVMRLGESPSYRLALTEYASLDLVLETVRTAPLPTVQWDRFAAHLSTQVDQAEAESRQSMRLLPAAGEEASQQSTGAWGRIGKVFAQPRRLAVAACVLLAASLSLKLVNQGGQDVTTPVQQVVPGDVGGGTTGELAVRPIPQAVETTGPLNVQIGPSYDPRDHTTITSVMAPPSVGQSPFDARGVAEALRQSSATRPGQSSVSRPASRPQTNGDSVDSTNDLFSPR